MEPYPRGEFYPVEGFLPEEVTFSMKMKRWIKVKGRSMNALTLQCPEPQSSSALELWEARTQNPSEGLVHVSRGCQLQLACRLAPTGLQSLPQKQPKAQNPGRQLLAAIETQHSQLKPPCRGRIMGSSLCFPSLGLN